jgi:DNA-directed RNA polymerase specialized sigma24 family protein
MDEGNHVTEDRDWLAERFEEHRAHLRAVGYRMLGSLTEADDAVQEAWLRLGSSLRHPTWRQGFFDAYGTVRRIEERVHNLVANRAALAPSRQRPISRFLAFAHL